MTGITGRRDGFRNSGGPKLKRGCGGLLQPTASNATRGADNLHTRHWYLTNFLWKSRKCSDFQLWVWRGALTARI